MSPLLLAGGGATVASSLLNYLGGRKADKARSSALSEERGRQAAYDAEADALNKGARERYVDFGDQQEQRAATLGDYFRPGITAPDTVMPATSSSTTAAAIDNARGAATAYGNQQGEALGNLRSFGDLLGDISRKQARDAGYVGQIGGFKRGSAAVTEYELDEASHAGDKYKFFGDLLAGAGKLAILGGLGGLTPAAAGAPTAVGQTVTQTPVGATMPQASPFAMQFNPYRLY